MNLVPCSFDGYVLLPLSQHFLLMYFLLGDFLSFLRVCCFAAVVLSEGTCPRPRAELASEVLRTSQSPPWVLGWN